MKTIRESEMELVEAAQNGDAHAFEILMLRYKTRLSRYLFRYLRDVDDTDDAVQESFIKAYLALRKFRGHSSFATWLFQIGINTARRSLARRVRRGLHLGDMGDGDEEGRQLFDSEVEFDTPESKMENQETLAILDHALDELPPDQRMSFELRELEGLSYDEIAWRMHCPVGTVRSRIHRARDHLAAALKAH